MCSMRAVVDIIVPVYRGYQDTRRCLESVLNYSQQTPFDIVVIDDASPEDEVAEYVRDLARASDRILLLRNDTNQGFVASVNRGMSLHPDRDVVILNSDTEVANNWLDRLYLCVNKEEMIGTVTPFSNNATICSFPKCCVDNEIPFGWSVESIDKVFAEVNAGKYVEIPTTVGFCMYIKRSCITDVGVFDVDTFGRGYGEENDFCMRAAQNGWRHVLCADTFVFHTGGISFASEQEVRIQAAQDKLDKLYPEYHQLVHAHIAKDPARPLRINAMMGHIRRSNKIKILFVTHKLGGGVEKHIQELGAYKQEILALVIRPGEDSFFVFSLDMGREGHNLYFSLPDDYQEIKQLCKYLGVSRVHFHHTMGIDTCLWRLAQDLSVPLDITLHDYYFINGNPTLVDINGRFCEDLRSRDDLCADACPIPGGATAYKWRKNQRVILTTAERIFAPSRYTADLFRYYYPELNPIVVYHPDWEQDSPYPVPRLRGVAETKPLRILVLGALSKEKGADVLEACAIHTKRKGYPLEFHLIGYAYRPLNSTVVQHGPYRDSEVDRLILDVEPHLIWFPSLWPETYSYTLSTAMRVAMPVVAPNIGSFPERLDGRPYTWVEPWGRDCPGWAEFFAKLRKSIFSATQINVHEKWKQPNLNEQPFTYACNYLEGVSQAPIGEEMDFDLERVKRFVYNNSSDRWRDENLSKKERVLVRLLKLREHPYLKGISRFVPYRMQRSIKRWLSRRPIHEIKYSDDT